MSEATHDRLNGPDHRPSHKDADAEWADPPNPTRVREVAEAEAQPLPDWFHEPLHWDDEMLTCDEHPDWSTWAPNKLWVIDLSRAHIRGEHHG